MASSKSSVSDKDKGALIAAACRDRDVPALVRLATSTAGLLSDGLRRTAWPLLLGCPEHDAPPPPWTERPPHKDEHQVGLDVARAFVYYPANDSHRQLDRRRSDLSSVILHVLRRHPALCYFQGYHDIVQVFLLVLGAHDAAAAVARLSLLRIRDFMLSTLDPAISQLHLLRPILRAADPELMAHLPTSQPSFALAHTITMFAHNIHDYADITRLFDFFLAHGAVMPIYLFAAVVLSRRDDLLDIEHEDEDVLYVTLGKLPQPFDVEFHIARTLELYERLPPQSLGSWEWWKISSSSVLRTAATVADVRRLTLQDGERFLMQQEKNIRRQQALCKASQNALYIKRHICIYRRYGYVGLAFIVGAYALWLGRRGPNARYFLYGSLGDLLNKFIGRSAS
ncbi:rab-GTPase-TBC domain-containing protein [Ampelomyces quisqualis]|uniref:Rab-GTPase-TBC domain-containing protein n=1 Tax=Ampelomyces quisqualis TaxID=50730 RepID=A0A6A5QB40_AMPQU|nr:rab-GTPase-TBC domain-containing protein [Ampelomyces quisqualis]